MALGDWYKPYRVDRAIVAPLDETTQLYGDSVEVINMNGFTMTPNHDNDEGRVGGVVEDYLSVLVSATLALAFLGIDVAFENIITGQPSNNSGASPNQVQYKKATAGMVLKPFGLIASVRATGDQYIHYHYPKVTLETLPSLEMGAENAFVVPDINAMVTRRSVRLDPNDPVVRYDLYGTARHETCVPLPTDFNLAMAWLRNEDDC